MEGAEGLSETKRGWPLEEQTDRRTSKLLLLLQDATSSRKPSLTGPTLGTLGPLF